MMPNTVSVRTANVKPCLKRVCTAQAHGQRNVPMPMPQGIGRGFLSPRNLFWSPLSPVLGHMSRARMNDMLRQIEKEMDQMFLGGREGKEREEMGQIGSFPVDVIEEKTCLKFVADMPGIKRENLKVRLLEDRMLLIEGEREEERVEDEGATKHVTQRFYGKFSRAFHLPANVKEDTVKASLREGVLTVTLQKEPEAAKEENVRDVPVESGEYLQ